MSNLLVTELLDLSGTVSIVSGASSGIGQAIACRFAEAGAAVVVHYHSNQQVANEVVETIVAAGGRAVALAANVTVQAEVQRLIEGSIAAFGRLDSVVNNAGIYPVHSLLEMPVGEWDAVVDANLKSVHLMTQAAAAHWVAQAEAGVVVNIASVEGQIPADVHAHYASAKAGVMMHTRAAALELGRHGIRVNAVAPGLIFKEGIEQAWPDGVKRWVEQAPLGRMGQPVEVADACLFLASRASRWTTGSTLTVDGGITSRAVF